MGKSSASFSVSTLLHKALAEAKQTFPEEDPQILRRALEEIMTYVTGIPWDRLFNNTQWTMNEEQRTRWSEMVTRWLKGEPLARIIGLWGFWNMNDLFVPDQVFIPRPETETLVEALLEYWKDRNLPYRFCDLGCGTGNLAIAAAREYPNCHVVAVDIDRIACQTVKMNAHRYEVGLRVHALCGEWLSAIRNRTLFHAILSNPPYVTPDEWEKLADSVKFYDPKTALVPHSPLDILYRMIAIYARSRLVPRGILVIEIGAGREKAVTHWLNQCGGRVIGQRKDIHGHIRCLIWQPRA